MKSYVPISNLRALVPSCRRRSEKNNTSKGQGASGGGEGARRGSFLWRPGNLPYSFVANMASYAISSEFDFGDSWQYDHWD
jgi:hypothetical protein